MGWNINLVKNTVRVPLQCAREIVQSNTDIGYTISSDHACFDMKLEKYVWTDSAIDDAVEAWAPGGELYFDYDHMEHMDYVQDVAEILQKHKVEGDIAFSSGEGDNAGETWCYRFDGKGGMDLVSKELKSIW